MGKDIKCDDYGKIIESNYAINEMKPRRWIISMNKILFRALYFIEILYIIFCVTFLKNRLQLDIIKN